MTPLMIADAETLFMTTMATSFPAITVLAPNTPVPTTQGTFAVIHVIAGDTFPTCLGINATSRNVGMIHVDIYTANDIGAGTGQDLAFAIGKMFRRKVRSVGVEGTVTYKDPSQVTMGEVRGKHMDVVKIPYRYDFSG